MDSPAYSTSPPSLPAPPATPATPTSPTSSTNLKLFPITTSNDILDRVSAALHHPRHHQRFPSETVTLPGIEERLDEEEDLKEEKGEEEEPFEMILSDDFFETVQCIKERGLGKFSEFTSDLDLEDDKPRKYCDYQLDMDIEKFTIYLDEYPTQESTTASDSIEGINCLHILEHPSTTSTISNTLHIEGEVLSIKPTTIQLLAYTRPHPLPQYSISKPALCISYPPLTLPYPFRLEFILLQRLEIWDVSPTMDVFVVKFYGRVRFEGEAGSRLVEVAVDRGLRVEGAWGRGCELVVEAEEGEGGVKVWFVKEGVSSLRV